MFSQETAPTASQGNAPLGRSPNARTDKVVLRKNPHCVRKQACFEGWGAAPSETFQGLRPIKAGNTRIPKCILPSIVRGGRTIAAMTRTRTASHGVATTLGMWLGIRWRDWHTHVHNSALTRATSGIQSRDPVPPLSLQRAPALLSRAGEALRVRSQQHRASGGRPPSPVAPSGHTDTLSPTWPTSAAYALRVAPPPLGVAELQRTPNQRTRISDEKCPAAPAAVVAPSRLRCKISTRPAALREQPHALDPHAAIDRLQHIVNREARDRHRGQRFHLHTRRPRRHNLGDNPYP